MKLIKRKKDKEQDYVRSVVREELEAHQENYEQKSSKEIELERKRKAWNKLSPRMKRAWLRKEGENGKEALIRLGLLQKESPKKKT